MAFRRALIALTLLALVPTAVADQDIEAGPASVVTQNNAWGDGDCDPAGSGASSRYAWAGVAVTEHEEVGVLVNQNCSTYAWGDEWGNYSEEWSSGSVQVGRFSDGNPGPVVQFSYVDHRYTYGSFEGRNCSSFVYVSGPAVGLGCYPDGGRWPMLPALP